MIIFVSGQIDEEVRIRQCYDQLRAAGLRIAHDWTQTDAIGDKLANRAESGRRAKADIDGVIDADIYILMSDNSRVGKGMYVELGAALARRQLTGKPEIFIV